MPIYEFQCADCGRITDVLIMHAEEERQVRCAACDSPRMKRLLSRCVVHQTEAQRLQAFDDRATRQAGFYKDDRNIGLAAKKRLAQLGVDLGGHMDEIVEKARSGKSLDAMAGLGRL